MYYKFEYFFHVLGVYFSLKKYFLQEILLFFVNSEDATFIIAYYKTCTYRIFMDLYVNKQCTFIYT